MAGQKFLALPITTATMQCLRLSEHFFHFHCTAFSRGLSSFSAIKIKSPAYNNTRGKPAHSSLVIISITIINSIGLNTDP